MSGYHPHYPSQSRKCYIPDPLIIKSLETQFSLRFEGLNLLLRQLGLVAEKCGRSRGITELKFESLKIRLSPWVRSGEYGRARTWPVKAGGDDSYAQQLI